MKYFVFCLIFVLGCSKNAKETSNQQLTAEEELSDLTDENNNQIDFDTSSWVEIIATDLIQLDIRYATENNFTKKQIYDCARCFLNKAAAKKFYQAAHDLIGQGYGIKLFDCYRPHPAQKRLWQIVPNPMYVADPAEGSMHNRGLAIDLTLTDSTGRSLDMGTEYDFFGPQAYHDFTDLDKRVLERRALLKSTLAKYGFGHIRTEWWHYSDTTQFTDIAQFEWPCPN